MLNLCVFIFIIYAVGYSTRTILFGDNSQKRSKAYCNSGAMRRKTAVSKKASVQRKPTVKTAKRKNNIIKFNKTKKSGRSEKSKRPVVLLYKTAWHKSLLYSMNITHRFNTAVAIAK